MVLKVVLKLKVVKLLRLVLKLVQLKNLVVKQLLNQLRKLRSY